MSDTEKEPDTNSIPTLVADDENQDGATMYKYRDFGNVPEDQEVEASPSPSPPPSSRGSLESSIRVQKFPVKLYAILAQKEFQDIITWMPHGRSWKVLKPNLFESLVMPLFFEYSNYHSFNRLVNAWSFRRISSGPDRGSYYHELFLRGKPHLQKYMRRLPKTHKKLPMKKEDEPDFYNLDKANPLPALEEVPLPASTMVPPIRPQQDPRGGLVPQMHGMGSPSAMTPAFHSLSGGKESFEPRDGLMGIGQPRQTNSFVNSNMGINGINNMNGMNGINNMNGMNGMNGINNMNSMNGINNMNSMNGINNLRESHLAQQGMGDFGSAFGQSAQLSDQYQRLRQIQQMQLFERQMGGGQMPLGNDPFSRMQARVNRQQC